MSLKNLVYAENTAKYDNKSSLLRPTCNVIEIIMLNAETRLVTLWPGPAWRCLSNPCGLRFRGVPTTSFYPIHPWPVSLSSRFLRQLLTIPYVALVLLATLTIGSLSYNTGKDAVDTLSDYLLKETVGRISQAVERHVAGSGAVLETAFTSGIYAPNSIAEDMGNLRTRLWRATSVHRDPHNYAYYGDRNGHFFGLWRYSETEAELRLRTDASSPSSIYHFIGIKGKLQEPAVENQIYDPRERPWYKAGQTVNRRT